MAMRVTLVIVSLPMGYAHTLMAEHRLASQLCDVTSNVSKA